MAAARRSAFADRLLEFPDFVFSDGAEFSRRGAWREFFGQRIGASFDGRVIFEIGCNDASFLAAVAEKHPAAAFVGIDWKCRALHTAAERLAGAGVRNVALLHGRAQDVRKIFADGEVDEVWVFHPDPCDKPQELRNRLIAEPFLVDAHHVLRPGGALVLKTDHPGYYQWVLGLLGLPEPEAFAAAREGSPTDGARVRTRDLMPPEAVPGVSRAVVERFEVAAASADFWNDRGVLARVASRAFANERTFFESRFAGKRLPIYFLEMRKR